MRRCLFLLLIGKSVFCYGEHSFSNILEYIMKQKQQQDTSQACLKQDIQVSSKRAKKRLRRWSHGPAEANTLARFSTVYLMDVIIFLAYWLQLTVKLNLGKLLCNALIQFMVACKCALVSSSPKWWSVSEFKSFQSNRRHRLTAETSVKAAVQLLKLKSQTITELCSH